MLNRRIVQCRIKDTWCLRWELRLMSLQSQVETLTWRRTSWQSKPLCTFEGRAGKTEAPLGAHPDTVRQLLAGFPVQVMFSKPSIPACFPNSPNTEKREPSTNVKIYPLMMSLVICSAWTTAAPPPKGSTNGTCVCVREWFTRYKVMICGSRK